MGKIPCRNTSSNFSRGVKNIDPAESIATVISISSRQLSSLALIRAFEYIGGRGRRAICRPTGSDSLRSSPKAPSRVNCSSDFIIDSLFKGVIDRCVINFFEFSPSGFYR